ncbi:HAMP domain-containing histidine kinase [Flavobacterium sufflavum]|uniref:histidine kinase n=1 Tax=Flavobacterium sufflavum TaxID=1921138 RepID=A0A3S2V7Q4_9FLAO|nr:HAMP domain-containing sensor histidine kinase [Flavobacterium sufflavum]RVT79811.1 HAMP domain-containing histidine kinase [Flavobacterium sufflavum]
MVYSFELFDSFIDSIAVINKKGEVIYTNIAWKRFSSENFGSLDKTDVGVNYLDICGRAAGKDAESATEALVGIQAVINREQALFQMEYSCNSLNEQRWFILRCTPLVNNVDLSIVSHINISQRKIAEEIVKKQNKQLKEINKRLDSTMFKITHDIVAPLNSVIGLIHLSRIDNESIDEYFSLIEKSASNLKSFVQETLELSKSTNKYTEVDFNRLLSDFYESVKYNLALEHVKIKTDVHQTVEFYTYKNEITSVISNLIDNSLKYYDNKKEESFVLVSIDSNGIEAKISIKDNGIGISKEMLSKIFDLNFQVEKEVSEGFGIGLSIVKQSVDLMDGVINVNSELGVGTEFNIIIPNLKQFRD